jgi:Flp pilus assembly protein TadG
MLRISRRRRGASAIEFALLYPVFLWTLTGVIDYGYFFMVRAQADTAVQQGARLGALTLQKDDPVSAAKEAVADRITASGLGLTPTVTAALGGASPDRYITVSVSLTVPPLVGLVPCPSTVDASTVMRVEDQG